MNQLFTWNFTMFLCNIAETAFMVLLHSTMLTSKPNMFPWNILKISLISLAGYLTIINIPMPYFVQFSFSLVLCFTYTLFFYGSIFRKLLSTVFSSCSLMLLFSILDTLESHLWQTSPSDTFHSISFTLFNESLVLLCGWFCHKLFPHSSRKHPLSKIEYIVSLCYPIIVTIAEFLLTYALQSTYNSTLFVLSILLFFALLIHFVLIELLTQKAEQNVQLASLEQRSISESEKAQALLDAYTTQRKLTHEFTNHMWAIKSLLHSKQYDEANQYIDQLSSSIKEQSLIVNTHNPLADAILSQKYTLATQLGIPTQLTLCDLSNHPMQNPDLVVILSNLFSNAIEGSSNVAESEINLKILNTDAEFLISIQNKVSYNIKIFNNCPPPSTKNGLGHGMGLQNVIDILKKYDSTYLIDCHDYWFKVIISINKHA